MGDKLGEEYPEAAPYIQKAVEKHGEDWVVKNYYPNISCLGVVMNIPDVEELPFYDEDKHDVMSEEEKREMGEALRKYRENLRTGTKPGKE